MGHVISFLNMKGGVGKTTLCKEMGFYLSEQKGKRVLFIDVDPQANLTQSVFLKYKFKHDYEISNTENSKYKVCNCSINNVFNYSSMVSPSKRENAVLDITPNLSLIPGDLNTVFLERTLGGSDKENSIKNFIEDHNLESEYDYIFLDCPPTYSFYTTAALLSSDFYISPITPDSYSILGLDLLNKVVQKLKSVHRDRFKYRPIEQIGVIFSNIPNTPSTGMQSLIDNITSSEELMKVNTFFFQDYFLKNPQIYKQADYFIADSNSKSSQMNLENIVSEFQERIEQICLALNTPEQN